MYMLTWAWTQSHFKYKSIVGLTSLFAVSTMNKRTLDKLKDFKRRTTWFESYRKKNNKFWPNEEKGDGEEILLSLVPKERLVYLLERLLDEDEFLSPAGIRALSKYHKEHPYSVNMDGNYYTIKYDPEILLRIYLVVILIGGALYGCLSIF